MAFSLGSKAFFVFTRKGDVKTTIKTTLPNGTFCDVITGGIKKGAKECAGSSIVVNNGQAEVTVAESAGFVAFHVGANF